MDLIELECPGCRELLEIDAGFAGGVCRCSTCGTLMTVPTAASNESPEQLTRPDRPDAPPPGSKRPRKRAPAPTTTAAQDAPTGLERAADDAASSDTGPWDISSSSETLPRQPKVARHATHVSVEGDMPSSGGFTYITSTGRQVQIHHSAIPTAQKRKRKVVRATTYLLILGVLAAFVGVTILAVAMMVAPPALSDPGDDLMVSASEMVNFNPFFDTKPRFLGLPLRRRPVIAIDASGASDHWFDAIKHALLQTATYLPPGTPLQVVFWDYGGPQVYPRTLRPWDASDPRGLLQVMAQIRPSGTVDPTESIQKALESGPDQIILVTSQQFDHYFMSDLTAMLEEKAAGIAVDVVALGGQNLDLRRMAEHRGDRYVNYTDRQFRHWWDAYRASDAMFDLDTILMQGGSSEDAASAESVAAPQGAETASQTLDEE